MSKKQNKKDSLDNIIENTFEHLKDIVDANTVVGNVIDIGNSMFLIPVSKISVGLVSGGGVMPKSKNNVNAGSGTGFNITPIGFITVANLNFNFLPVNTAADMSKGIIDSLMKIYETLANQEKEKNDEK